LSVDISSEGPSFNRSCEGNGRQLSKVADRSEFDVKDSSMTRKLIMQYIDAGILFPEEIRHAE
jgi:hypothetical protein